MNYFYLTLDTTSPSNASISIESGLSTTAIQLVNCQISTGDTPTTNYQMKLWGDVDVAFDTNIQDTELNSTWITFNATQQINLSSGDGSKTIYLKIRDDVYNESATVNDSILLSSIVPVVNITAQSVSKISKNVGKDVCSFNFQSDVDFDEYIVKVVSINSGTHDTGIQIPTTNGSINMCGNTGGYLANNYITCTIKGSDLELANAGDGDKIIKVFVKNTDGVWSV